MPPATPAGRTIRRFFLKSAVVAACGVFAGGVAVVWTRPGETGPRTGGYESEVRVRAAFDQRLTLDVPADPPTHRTSRSAPHVRPPGAEPPEYPPIPATNLPTEPIVEPPPASPIRAAAPREQERVTEPDGWKRDPRFSRLTVEVRDGTAVIGGRARTHTAAWELAEQVRAWPAVERVVVGRVELSR